MNFTCKARYVANGAMTYMLMVSCYSIIVSCDSARIEFLVAALKDLYILACDISNAFFNAPCRKRIRFVTGMECGKSLEGKVMKLVRALYGLKSSGAIWRKMLYIFWDSPQALLTLTCVGNIPPLLLTANPLTKDFDSD